jgi:hypothetical protein
MREGGDLVIGKMTDLSNMTTEDMLKMLYENSKWNRKSCSEKGDVEGEYFWSGTLNGLYATLDNLNIQYDWLKGREIDFNEYSKSR